MQKLRELFSDTLIYGIGNLFFRFVNYLLVPFYTGVFDPASYSVVTLVFAAIALLNVVMTLGMESAYLRYAKERNRAPDLFRSLQVTLFGTATLFAFLIWMAEPMALPLLNLDGDTAPIYLMMIGILWFDTLSIVPFAELRLVRRSWMFVSIKGVHVGINLFLNFWLILGLGMGVEAVFLSNLVASAAATLLAGLATLPMWKGRWNSNAVAGAFRFGWPFIPAGLGYVVNEMLDRFFLNAMDPARVEALYGSGYAPEDIVGIYGACYKLAVFMLLLIQMFRLAWQPFFMRHSDSPEAPALFARAFVYFNLAATLIYLGVGLFAREIVAIQIPLTGITLIDSRYWLGLEIVPLLLLAYWFHGWYIHFSAGIFIRERTAVLPRIMFTGAGITVIANLVLVPLAGMTGAAWATLLSYGVMALLLYRSSRSAFEVPYSLAGAFLLMGMAVGLVFLAPLTISMTGFTPIWVKLFFFLTGSAVLARILFALPGDGEHT